RLRTLGEHQIAVDVAPEDLSRVALPAVPRGDLVPPPELARDAPVADVLHPPEVDLLPMLGDEARLLVGRSAVADRGDRRLRERLDLHEPLDRQHRLDDRPTAVALCDRKRVRLDLFDETVRFEILDELLPRVVAVETRIGTGLGAHLRVRVHDGN